jgi:phosphopentomutase
MIQSNPILKDKTTLFITNDHGRHLDGKKTGFVSHGDNCSGCRHISLLALGPDIEKGKKVDTEAELIDISKTISKMMHFEMPTSNGRFLNELFIPKK